MQWCPNSTITHVSECPLFIYPSTCIFDLPPKLVPHVKLEFCHFMLFSVTKLQELEGGYSMSYAA